MVKLNFYCLSSYKGVYSNEQSLNFVIPIIVILFLGIIYMMTQRADSGYASFILIGDTDRENPAAISTEQLKIWHDEKSIEWWGRRSDVPEILQRSTIACLPSYREGMPKFLLEAASAGLPIVTTDVPGCREVVINDENGYLVPPRNSEALADAIDKLLNDKTLRREMGEKGRALVEREFGIEKIVEETLSLYQRMLRNL